jgi:hypothetical protein
MDSIKAGGFMTMGEYIQEYGRGATVKVDESLEYAPLNGVLKRAYEQAKDGKGKERHAKDKEPFDKQKICEITRRVGLGYPLGQAIKKAEESQRLSPEAAVKEILGAINYLAAAVIVIEEGGKAGG